MFTATLFIIAQDWKQPRPSTNEWVKQIVVHTYHGILSNKRKRGTTDTYNNLYESPGNYVE